MIIVSQDKRMVINFDNIVGIVIRKNTQENIFQVQCKAENEKNARILGKDATEERAKDVLQEIETSYSLIKILPFLDISVLNGIKGKDLAEFTAYKMPKE